MTTTLLRQLPSLVAVSAFVAVFMGLAVVLGPYFERIA